MKRCAPNWRRSNAHRNSRMLKIPIRNNMKLPLHNPPLWLVNLTAFGVLLASLTKLMTAVVASETLPSYTSVEIVPRGEEYDARLRVGEKWPLKELLAYTLMTSSNSGADSVAAAASSYLAGRGPRSERVGEQNLSLFVEDMNMKARELGLDQTYFLNPSGLDTDTHLSGAYGSAQDVAILIGYIVTRHPDLLVSTGQLEKTFSASDGRNISVKNTNEHVDRIPGLIGSKTC